MFEFVVLFGFSILLLVFTFYLSGKKNSLNIFLVSDRKVTYLIGALSVAAAWTWAPAIFVSSQQAYEKGLAGAFWFATPNVLALFLLAFLAKKLREIMNKGYTLPQFINKRFDKRMHLIYIIAILIVQVYAIILQLIGSSLLLNILTGISKTFLTIFLGVVFLLISSMRGLRSSIMADVVKAGLILIVIFSIVPWATSESGGIDSIREGIGGKTGKLSNIFDPQVVWNFGIPTAISLLAAVTIDQQLCQRTFSIKNRRDVKKVYMLGGIIFAITLISLSILGFLAANSSLGIQVSNSQLAGVHTIKALLPSSIIYIFAVMVLGALLAAGSSALSAASSVSSIDIYRNYINPRASDERTILVARMAMIIIVLIGVSVTLIPNIQIIYLLMLVGAFRGALMIPTILSLYWDRLSLKPTFYGILIAMVVGPTIFLYGTLVGKPQISTWGSIAALVISASISIIGSLKNKEKYNFSSLKKMYK